VTAINSLHHWQDYKKGLLEVDRVLRPNGSFFIANDIVDGDTCGHGDGPLEKPNHIISILDQAGFINISIKKYYNEKTGIYLISSKKP
jgi:SAM-dependent methyltransferase